jgi:hypothetical protein
MNKSHLGISDAQRLPIRGCDPSTCDKISSQWFIITILLLLVPTFGKRSLLRADSSMDFSPQRPSVCGVVCLNRYNLHHHHHIHIYIYHLISKKSKARRATPCAGTGRGGIDVHKYAFACARMYKSTYHMHKQAAITINQTKGRAVICKRVLPASTFSSRWAKLLLRLM